MIPTGKHYHYVVRVKNGSASSFAGFLDMLRYDRARVVDWTNGLKGTQTFAVTIQTERPATIERWESFGLYLREKA